nr:NUDIX hydrolase [Alloscardovia criceti]
MVNPADVFKMLQRRRAVPKSAQNSADSHPDVEIKKHIEIAYSAHFASDYFMEDEEYRTEYDLELDTQADASHLSSISSSVVPLYSTSSTPEEDKEGVHPNSYPHEDSHTILEQIRQKLAPTAQSSSRFPTPAIMPKKRDDLPANFASLDNRDLPVVREYSAGGLIFDDKDRVAIIARHSRSGHLEWCLPKGHIEKGETPDQTAVREIHEETGIIGEVVDSIATIDYWFTGDSQRVHKLVHHYALRMTGGYLTVEGDPDHEAEDATWVKFDDLTDVLSYPNERRIVWLYAKKHRKDA